MRHTIHLALGALLFVGGCGGSSNGTTTTDKDSGSPKSDGGGGSHADSGTKDHDSGGGSKDHDSSTDEDSGATGDDAGNPGSDDGGMGDDGGGTGDDGGAEMGDAGQAAGPMCGTTTLFAGNPNFANPGERPSDGANILTGTPYLYQQLHFMSGGQILTNDQLSVWSIDTSTSELHAVAGGPLTGNPALSAAPAPGVACSDALFADILGSAVDSNGNLFVADYANAILKVTSPLKASACMVSYFAGSATENDAPNLDQTDGNSGTMDGKGSAAQFTGPQYLTIDDSDNLYVLDHGTAWSIRKITPDAVVSTIAKFSDNQYAYGELQFLSGKVWFWARGNDKDDADTANLIAINPAATTPVMNPASLLTFHAADLGGDSSESFETGGITTDGKKLYIEAIGQIFSIDVSGTKPVLSSPLAGENDDNWTEQDQPDFASGYNPKASHTSAKVELFSLDESLTWGVDSYLSLDTTGNLYFTAESTDVYVVKIAGCP